MGPGFISVGDQNMELGLIIGWHLNQEYTRRSMLWDLCAPVSRSAVPAGPARCPFSAGPRTQASPGSRVQGGPRMSGAFPQPASPGGQRQSRSGAPWGWGCPGQSRHGEAGARCSVAQRNWGHLGETGPLCPSRSLGSRHLGQPPAVRLLCYQKQQTQTLVLSPAVRVSRAQRRPSLSLGSSSVRR